MENIQLTPAQGYDVENMLFADPVESTAPGSFRINISTKYPDGTSGPLILPVSRLFSFGVSENRNPKTGELNGWSFPLCLYNKEGPTDAEKEWVDTFNAIVNKCAAHLIETGPDMDKEITEAELKKEKGGLNPLYWKREKALNEKTGKTVSRVVPGTGPTLYPKLIYSQKTKKFISKFFDMQDKSVDPLTLIGKYCYADAAIKIESIFVGKNPSIQIKLWDCQFEPSQTSMTRLTHAPKPPANSSVLQYKQTGSTKIVNPLMGDEDNQGDDGSLGNSDDDEGLGKSTSTPAPTKPNAQETKAGTSKPPAGRNVKPVIPGKTPKKAGATKPK